MAFTPQLYREKNTEDPQVINTILPGLIQLNRVSLTKKPIHSKGWGN